MKLSTKCLTGLALRREIERQEDCELPLRSVISRVGRVD